MKPIRFSSVLLFILVVFPGMVYSQAATGPYDGIDVLFLVDQSGSMGGRAFGYPDGGEGTDPLSLRFDAVQYALDTLGQYRLTIAPEIPIRMAVINFGDQPSSTDISRSWQPIAENASEAEWDAIRGNLLDYLSVDTFRATNSPANLGNTNFLGAFDAANELFDNLPKDENHLHAIIMLTDGAPCVPGQFDCSNLDAQRRHMSQLITLVHERFPSTNYRIYLLALDASGNLWDRWQNDWQEIAGTDRAVRVETSQQVGSKFLNILIDLIEEIRGPNSLPVTQLVPGANTIAIPPYLREVRISIFKSTASPGILDVIQPDGNSLQQSDPQLVIENADRPIEIWNITTPSPGNWIFTVGSTSDRIDVYLELIPITVQVEFTSETVIQHDDVNVLLYLTDDQGKPLAEYPAPYTLDVEATITFPDGKASIFPLTRIDNEVYKANFVAEQAGTYTIGVTAQTVTPAGQIQPILQNTNVGAFDALRIIFEAQNAPQGQFLVGNSQVITASLLDERGNPLSVPALDVYGEVTTTNSSSRYPFVISSPGQYNLTLPFDKPGTFTFKAVASTTRNDSSVVELKSTTPSVFNILPSQLISLVLVEPTETTQNTTKGFPPFFPNDTSLRFNTLVDGRTPIAVESIVSDPNAIWILNMSRNGEAIAVPVSVQPVVDTPGTYEVVLSNLDAAEYNLHVGFQGSLTGTYVVDPSANQINLTITRVVSPLYYASIGVIALAVIASVVFFAFRVRRAQIRRQHPAKGTLAIREVGTDSIVWEAKLDRFGSNTIRIKDKTLKRANVTEILVTCPDNKMSQNRRIKVTVKNGRDVIVSERIISPGSPPIRLAKSAGMIDIPEEGKVYYELIKDPDEDWGGI